MPFKLKLKKSRQYNVSSKNLFVISVELLDNTTVECTLSAQSLGQECLNNVCQRLGLHQPQYFGLRFLSKKGTYWWLELQRPLKKQMDKYAQENATLHLGVMYFVSDVNMLHDEVTRYHYFLQLKADILQGKLHCSEEQTVLFASYSLQAEFGDHDAERHTTEYLTNFGLLPKHVAHGKDHQEAILEKVIHTHRSLQGMSQQLAEVYYIREAQNLDGYGQECFPGKDASGTALFVCLSLKGIFIRYMNDHPSSCFLWEQIVNLVHHKRCFGIECIDSPKVVQTFMEDSHVAKYVWKTCIQQHQFYNKNEEAIRCGKSATMLPNAAVVNSNLKQVIEEEVPRDQNKGEASGSKTQLQESQESLDGLGVYHTESGYSERISPTVMYSHGAVTKEHVSPPIPKQHNQLANCSTSSLTSSTPALQASYSHPLPQTTTIRVSSSAVQLHGNISDPAFFQLNQVPSKSDMENGAKCSLLPSYRQAPDYDTAVKLKYGIQSSSDLSSSSPLIQSQSAPLGKSQMDVYHVLPYQQAIPLQSYAQYKNYNDLSHLDVSDVQAERSELPSRHYENVPVSCVAPPVHTYSSPELASQSVMHDIPPEQVAANMHLLYQFKPPPPYPYKQSSSTPDLTKNHLQQLPVNSSPNAVSAKDIALANQYNNYQTPLDTIQNVELSPNNLKHGLNQNFHQLNNSPSSCEPNSSDMPNLSTSNSNYRIPSSRTQADLPVHTYQNYNPLQVSVVESTACRVTEPVFSTVMTAQSTKVSCQLPQSATVVKSTECSGVSKSGGTHHFEKGLSRKPANLALKDNSQCMGPMLVAAMNGLTLSQPDIVAADAEDSRFPVDSRIQALESKLAEGQVFLEFEHIIKKKSMPEFTTALMPENVPRNRFKDVFPYEENRVILTPTNENKTGYINASHLSVSIGGTQRFYIAAQGPLLNTLYSFWQMIWEHHVSVIVMLTEVQEEGQDKCFPYWPQEDDKTLQIGEFQIIRNFSMSSPTYVTCSLTLCYVTSNQQRNVWHIQYTDWPDHSCPEDVQGFIRFMGEVDAVRRLAVDQQSDVELATSPIVVHCSAGVGRSGVVVLCDIMLYALDHNQPIDIPKILTQLRLQRMLTVQTLAQYKFVYVVLIQYLRNSRLI